VRLTETLGLDFSLMEAHGQTGQGPRLAVHWEQNPSEMSGSLSLTSHSVGITTSPLFTNATEKCYRSPFLRFTVLGVDVKSIFFQLAKTITSKMCALTHRHFRPIIQRLGCPCTHFTDPSFLPAVDTELSDRVVNSGGRNCAAVCTVA